MTASTSERSACVAVVAPQWTSRPTARLRAGQIVATQVAAAVLIAAAGRGVVPTAVALLSAALLLPAAWVRVRGRWLHEWLVTAAAYLTRRRALPAAADPAALLELLRPGAVVGATEASGGAAVLHDAAGLTALLELGDPDDLLGDHAHELTTPFDLLPPTGPEAPAIRLQLVFSSSPAPAPAVAGGPAGTSYRQLTDGRLAGRARVVLAVQVLRADGWPDEDLLRALSGTLRRLVRRLGPLTARPLGGDAALRVIAELAHHEPGAPVRETWPLLTVGGLTQATWRLGRWPDARGEAARGLVGRLLALPATATTVALTVGPRTGTAPVPGELAVRVAAGTTAELSTAERTLRRVAGDAGGELRRLDGEHLAGLAATLPLAASAGGAFPAGSPPPALDLPPAAAGLMVGANRHGAALTVRLFRPATTRVLLVGGVPAAQLLVLRALALGARVVVQTGRPRFWEPFVRGVGTVGGGVPLLPPGRPVGGAPGSPLRPLLVVVDAGPVPPEAGPAAAWQSVLVVRDELTPADTPALARADLAILQPLDPDEAALAGAALGLGDSAEWLTRIRDDMVAVVNRRALRWALLSPTPVESQLVGRPARH
ncbi:type VII secretion protein EccE [Micromonospora tulbaghiae]|uniref:Type VII secretion protein EccE n=1 Tax=Micromonospora tulbaghiae TaxID=479978 RepID=A0AAW4JKK7_9ACTN|nr:type VII secretion protein EccE [Micromonospora tulbaghiae]MBO4142074.1 type VII secretion protein EccE [Micromonospora tulbaghiae]MDX5456589.1 type VII secretion protein EccE [Micromonospora tulbaghiae]SCE66952.1 type VII secretion protein EccE [Micromonospora tulbaghiae]